MFFISCYPIWSYFIKLPSISNYHHSFQTSILKFSSILHLVWKLKTNESTWITQFPSNYKALLVNFNTLQVRKRIWIDKFNHSVPDQYKEQWTQPLPESVFKSVTSIPNNPLISLAKNWDQWFFTKEVSGLFGIDIADLNRSMGNDGVHRSSQCMLYRDWKWRKVTSITKSFPNKNLTF